MRAARVRASRAGWALPVFAGTLIALLAALALTITHHEPRPTVPPRTAIRAALHDPQVERLLAGSRWDHITVNSLDDKLEHVTFFAGGRLMLSVTVYPGLIVTIGQNGRASTVPYGDWIAYQPAMLVALSALFVLMAGVAPWRRIRNLDVAACVSFLAPVVLFRHEYLDASVVTALPGMGYLLARCLLKAFGRSRVAPSQRPLLAVVTPGLDPARRVHWLRVLLVVLALVFLMVGVSSPEPLDVLYATMEGATTLIHGILPYGHLSPWIAHGDTYPILSYALYTPLALFAPVNSPLGESVDAGLAVAVLAALGAAWALSRMAGGARTRARAPLALQSEEAGLRAAVALLTFPSLLVTVSTGTTDVMLAAMLALALILWRRPAAGAAMLAIAGWFKLAPFALLPIRVAPLRGRELVRALIAVAIVSLPLVALLLILGGPSGPADMVRAVSFQFSRGSLQSAWSVLGIEHLQPLAQGCVLGVIAAAVVKLRREPGLVHDRVRMAALMAAILIGLELTADYWAFLYLTWLVPVVGLSLLADGAPAPATLAVTSTLPTAAEPAAALAT